MTKYVNSSTGRRGWSTAAFTSTDRRRNTRDRRKGWGRKRGPIVWVLNWPAFIRYGAEAMLVIALAILVSLIITSAAEGASVPACSLRVTHLDSAGVRILSLAAGAPNCSSTTSCIKPVVVVGAVDTVDKFCKYRYDCGLSAVGAVDNSVDNCRVIHSCPHIHSPRAMSDEL